MRKAKTVIKPIRSSVYLVIVLLITLCLLQSPAPLYAQDASAETMSRLSVADKVGQLFIVPFIGSNTDEKSDIWQLLTEYKIGGVILQSANSNFSNDDSTPRQVTELTNNLKSIAFKTNEIPLFISLDHEGDDFPYTRITSGVTPIPSQMAIGATWNSKYAETIGQIVGEELSAMGINLLLGPSLDVLNDPRPTGRGDMGVRVFGGDPYWVSQLGRAYIRGVHVGSKGQVATVSKHFPGHGGSDRLPDNEVATVDKSLQELQRIELPPFFHVTADLSDDPLGMTDALMSSHIRYRGFQGDIRQFTTPISFDAEGMKMLFKLPEIVPWQESGGVMMSDALGVPAVRKYFDPSGQTFPHRRIAKEAFLAGNDILSLCQFDARSIWTDQFINIKDTVTFFQTEYNNNSAFAKQVDIAVSKILRLKFKLYPKTTAESLTNDPDHALKITAKPHPIINEIAQQSLTLLYPSLGEFRLPSPRADDKILIIADTRLARECYLSSCLIKELLLPRNIISETILRLYGPKSTGQIQPENINTITFSELKVALAGSITPTVESIESLAEKAEPHGEELKTAPSGVTNTLEIDKDKLPEDTLIQHSVEETRKYIQTANWLIFAALDLNTRGYSDSDALKLFLAQESGMLRDKTTVVLALNAPYYLDTTEITKLTAYYGIYSKTMPHLEAAIRALFGEITPSGSSPVSVEGIGYELVDVLAPHPSQNIPIQLIEASPENQVAPTLVRVKVGPVVDYNGHLVPEGTPIQLRAVFQEHEVDAVLEHTKAGMVEGKLTLTEPGQIQIFAVAGQVRTKTELKILVVAPTPTPTSTPTKTPTATPTLTATPTATPIPTSTLIPPLLKPSPPPVQLTMRRADGLDFLSALSATLLAGLLGFWLGQQVRQPIPQQVRFGLWVFIGGLSAYLLYGAGWLRPETWLIQEPNLLMSRVVVAGLAFMFSGMAMGLDKVRVKKLSKQPLQT